MKSSYSLVQLTPEAAMEFERRVYNVTDPNMQIGWVPYTYRVTRNACALFACHDEEELQRWLKSRDLKISRWSGWRGGARTALLVSQ